MLARVPRLNGKLARVCQHHNLFDTDPQQVSDLFGGQFYV